jgi:hypothetical protein
MNSLVKFVNHKDGNGRGKLFWERADVDGLPFRGHQAPLYRNEEYEERLVKVADPKNGTFYTGDSEQNASYLKVLDGISNSWYQLVHIDRWRNEGDNYHYVYVEWVEYYLEDGKPSLYDNPTAGH